MNINTVYIQGHVHEFSVEEVASVLEAGVLNREQLLVIVAARVAGFDHTAVGSLINGVEGHPAALAKICELWEQQNAATFAALVDEIVAVSGGERNVRRVWKQIRNAISVPARDVLLSLNSKLVALAAEKPTPKHRKDRAERAFAKLLESKAGGNRPQFEGHSVTSY